MNRETEKMIEVMGRKFKIGKFDAFTGSYILFQLFEKIVPMGSLQQELPKNRMAMNKEEFVKLQRDCLSVISEVLPAGPRPIFNENGSWGLNDIEHNTPLVILLTIHALAFNVGDFFAAGGLTELQSSLAGLFPVSSQI